MGVELTGFDDLRDQLEGAQEAKDGEAWVGTAVYYGVFLEFGAPGANLKPRPWLRRTILNMREVYSKKLLKGIVNWTVPETVETSPLEFALEVERRIKANMGGQGSPAPEGDFPAVDTGNLRASIAAGESPSDMLSESAAGADDPDTVAQTL